MSAKEVTSTADSTPPESTTASAPPVPPADANEAVTTTSELPVADASATPSAELDISVELSDDEPAPQATATPETAEPTPAQPSPEVAPPAHAAESDDAWFGAAQPTRQKDIPTLVLARKRGGRNGGPSGSWALYTGLALSVFALIVMAYSFTRNHRENVMSAQITVVQKAAEIVKAPPAPAAPPVLEKFDASKCNRGSYKKKKGTKGTYVFDASCIQTSFGDTTAK